MRVFREQQWRPQKLDHILHEISGNAIGRQEISETEACGPSAEILVGLFGSAQSLYGPQSHLLIWSYDPKL